MKKIHILYNKLVISLVLVRFLTLFLDHLLVRKICSRHALLNLQQSRDAANRPKNAAQSRASSHLLLLLRGAEGAVAYRRAVTGDQPAHTRHMTTQNTRQNKARAHLQQSRTDQESHANQHDTSTLQPTPVHLKALVSRIH